HAISAAIAAMRSIFMAVPPMWAIYCRILTSIVCSSGGRSRELFLLFRALTLRKGRPFAKFLTIDQDCSAKSAQSAAAREQRHEIHLVQPDAVALSAGRFPGEESLGLGR